ncbi:MAG: IPT/TIG domain-containing protein [Actinobacteria bacterium]|nr:IPT/TIG domain-containing protein [Actinomycetota bacterium]
MSERTRRHMWRRMVLGALGLGLLGLPLPLTNPVPADAAGGPAFVKFAVAAAVDGPDRAPFADAGSPVHQGDAISEFKWQINEDNIGDPSFSDANIAACMPQSAGTGELTSAAADGDDSIADCTWPSIRAIDGNSPVVANGDQNDIPTGGLELVDGQKYLVSITAPGFKIDGAHFTATAGSVLTVPVLMNPVPLPTVTVRVNVFNDNASTNGQYDGVSEDNSDMSGFTAHLNDIAGEVAFDVFGNPLCTKYETDGSGNVILDGDGSPIMIDGSGGFLPGGVSECISDASGQIVIPNLGPNRYAVTVSPPDPQTQDDIDNPWIQTTTLEGGHDWDTWNMEGSTGFDTELVVGGEATPFVYFGYVKRQNALPASGGATISGRLMVGRTYVAQQGGLPNAGTIWGGGTSTVNEKPVEDGWVSLACLAGCPTLSTDLAVYVDRAREDGTFDITNVPDGTYSLTVWDEAQIRLLDFVQVSVRNGQNVNVGTFPLAGWFTDLDGSVFLDRNGNGKRDGIGTSMEEPGIPNFGLTLRTRVNTLQDQGAASASTDPEGNWSMAAYPLGQFLILEAYHPGYKTVGFTWKLNNESTSKTFLSGQVDWNVLNIFGLGGHFDVGVQPYAPGENGGIVGTVSYDVTRNELNPRNAAAEDWQPGVPDVEMQLWTPRKNGGSYELAANGAIKQYGAGGCVRPESEYGTVDEPGGCDPLDATATEHWSRPTGCAARTADGQLSSNQALPPFVPNTPDDAEARDGSPCVEAPMMGVQFGTNGEVDGNYGFETDTTGDYLVEAVPPADTTVLGTPADPRPLYKFTDEASINVFTGNTYVPQEGWVADPDGTPSDPGAPLTTGNGYSENTSESACAGALHMIDVNDINNPDFAANGGSPVQGSERPYCDVKLVKVQPRRSIAPIFHVYTDVPLPTRFVGYIIDDLSVSTDPKSTVYGEKAGMPNVPVGAYDYRGRLVYTAESDYNGYYEMLLPSTDTIACPTPSGVCPNVFRLIGNDPGQLGHPNANFNPQYRTISTNFQGWPGVVHPVDQAPTRVAASFQLPGGQVVYPPACAVPATQPEFFRIDRPYWRKPNNGGSPTFTITGRNFGTTAGTLIIGGNSYLTTTWSDTQITFSLPASTPTGPQQLRIVRGDNGVAATNAITFHVIGSGYPARIIEVGTFTETPTGPSPKFNPANDPIDGSGPRAIQRAIEAADGLAGNSIIVVYPNEAAQYADFNPDQAYFENLVVHNKVKLQGVGPGSTTVPGSRIDGRYYWSVNEQGTPTYQDYWQTLVEGLPVAGNPAMSEGEVIYVRPERTNQFNAGSGNNSFATSIDGFTITGGDQQGQPTNMNFIGGGPVTNPQPVNAEAQGGGVFLNSYANNTIISNNVFQSNGGTFGGAIRVGTPELSSLGGSPDNHNDNVRILSNRIVANGGTNLAGAIGIFYGSDDYRISGNDICGNSSAEYGGGISHYGVSQRGRIDHNRIGFNQAYDEGGGVMIAGELPTNTGQLSTGAGQVTVDANEIVANLSNDDGGGLRFLMAGGPNNARMTVTNNIIANNVATHEGAGVAIDDTPDVRIVNNTIVKNITTATAMTSDGLPAPAGVSTGANSALLQARLNRLGGLARSTKFSNPVLLNNIFWDNRAGTWTASGVTGIGLAGDASPIFPWDVGTTDGSGTPKMFGSVYDSAPSSPLYHGGTGFNATGNGNNLLAGGPNPAGFKSPYDVKVSIASWRTFPNFRPAAIVTLDLPIRQLADYRLSTTRPGPERVIDGGLAQATAASAFSPTTVQAAATDIDDGTRTLPDVGADEFASAASITAPLRLAPPATFLDRFNRANSSNLGGSWTNRPATGTCQVFRLSNNRAQSNGCAGIELWTSALGANQEAGVRLITLSTSGNPGVALMLKAQGSVGTTPQSYLEVRYNDATSTVQVGYATAGTVTYLASINANFNNGDFLRVQARPDGRVEVFRNDVSIGIRTLPAAWTPALNADGGQIGLRLTTTTNIISVDDFFGGNL